MKRCLTSTTRCNRCAFAEYQRLAKETNRVVTLQPKPIAKLPGGQEVFIHPLGVRDEELAEWRVGWLGSVPEYCEC